MGNLLIAGVIVLVVFYLLILVVGVLSARLVKTDSDGSEVNVRESEEVVVAGRSLRGVVATMTMIATTVGGGFINGSAESIVTGGLAWTISPFAITVGLTLGGLIFAGPMRRGRYVTMLHPLLKRYGRLVTALVYLASLCGDLFWTAAILNALGTSLSVVMGIPVETSILVSAAVTILYTMIGQMISVAYTDVAQLLFMTLGLVLCIPFIATNDRVGSISQGSDLWLGQLDNGYVMPWIDLALAMILGTIPWQSYFQRVLSVRTVFQAQYLSVLGGLGSLLFAIPPILIGAYSTVSDWSNCTLTSGLDPMSANQSSMVLPLMLKEFTPDAVSILGLGAVSAAVMSSMDSAVLGSSSMFTHNLYRPSLRPEASDRELLWVQRLSVVVIGAAATVMSIYIRTVWGLFVLAADIVYVIVLPQLTCALFVPFTNSYGALAAFLAGAILRIGAGESTLNLPAFIQYPLYDNQTNEQKFPFRAIAFAASLFFLLVVSKVTAACFKKDWLPASWNRLGGEEGSDEGSGGGKFQKYSLSTENGNSKGKNENAACFRYNPAFIGDAA